MSSGRRVQLAAAGFVGGLAVGLVVWSTQVQRSRRELFSRSPVRRYAALGFLAGRPSAETASLLAHGTSSGAPQTDFFGHKRGDPPTIGAVELP